MNCPSCNAVMVLYRVRATEEVYRCPDGCGIMRSITVKSSKKSVSTHIKGWIEKKQLDLPIIGKS